MKDPARRREQEFIRNLLSAMAGFGLDSLSLSEIRVLQLVGLRTMLGKEAASCESLATELGLEPAAAARAISRLTYLGFLRELPGREALIQIDEAWPGGRHFNAGIAELIQHYFRPSD